MAAQGASTADIVIAISAAISALITTTVTAWVTVHQGRKSRRKTEQVNEKIATSNGRTAGQYLEGLAVWADQHTEDDNELRKEFGLRPGSLPKYGE